MDPKHVAVAIMATVATCGNPMPGPNHAPNQSEWHAIEAALASWDEAGLPNSASCEPDLESLRIATPEGRDFTSACYAGEPGCDLDRWAHCASACSRHACWGGWWETAVMAGRCDKSSVIVIHASLADEPNAYDRVIIHEMLHVLERCTAYPPVYARDWHSDPDVWAEAGGDSSVQARAESEIGL